MPVFLRLRRLTAADLEQDHPLAVLLARELVEVSGGTLPPDLGERLWRHGRLLLLLDGLDEIADEALRARVCNALPWDLQASVRAVLSCRFAGYGNRVQLDERFLPLEVRPLDADQCRRLVELWFREVPRALPDHGEAEARRAADRLTTALDSPGYGTQAWKVLIGSPLLLTLLCLIVLRGGLMPRQRVDFYEKSLRVLLERRRLDQQDDAGPAAPPLDAETAVAVLRSLAWDLHRAGRRDDLKKLAAVNAIEERLEALGKEADGFRVLDWLYREAGILVEAAPGEYGFLHLGLQEYLTALEIASRVEELLDDPAAQWTEEWWQEVLLLLVGLPGRRLFVPLLKRLLASPAVLAREDLLRACRDEAAEEDLEPFLERLGPAERPELHALVLRLLLGRSDPRLLARAAELQSSPDPSVAALAESLVRESSLSPAAGRELADLVLLPHPRDQEGASALADYLRRAGWRVVLVGTNPPEDELFGRVRAVALLWGPGGKPAWEIEELAISLRIFSRRRPALLALRLPGGGDPPALPDDWKGSDWIDLGQKLSPECVTVIRRALAGERPAGAREAAAPAVAGKAFTDPLTGIRFLWIPGGRFQMGGDAYNDEKPIHWVQISPFWLGETPVTNRQYGVFLQATGAGEPDYWRDQRYSSPDQPVVGVSWEDAVAFCRWLSEASGWRVMLPGESQWEFAARGTDGREYPWGNEPPNTTRAGFNLDFRKGRPAAVGSYPTGRGPFGTHDQAGNVWEWCRDAWNKKAYAKRMKRGAEPVDPVEGENLAGEEVQRVLRGGGWFNPAVGMRAAYRSSYPAWRRSIDIGFRVAVVPATSFNS